MAQAPQQHHQHQQPPRPISYHTHGGDFATDDNHDNHDNHDSWLTGGQHRPYPEHDPYATPKLAQPVHTPVHTTPAPATPLGQRAKKTIPMERRALNTATEILTRDRCWRCAGTGRVDRPTPMCQKCRRMFSSSELTSNLRHNWRGKLPCGHSLDYQTEDYMTVPCPTCDGSPAGAGYLPRHVTFGELLHYILRNGEYLNAFLDLLEECYPQLVGEHTAEQRMLSTSQFSGSNSEPSAPTPHLSPHYPTGAPAPAPTPASYASPHLPPLAPDRPERSTGH